MKNLNTVILFFFIQILNAQITKNDDFIIEKPQATAYTNYNDIYFIDSRKEKAHCGIVQKGAFNTKALVQPTIELSKQIETLFNDLKVVNISSEDTLVFQLRDLKFAEITGSFSEKGYFTFRANSYLKKNSTYIKITSIDTTQVISAADVTQKNYKNASKVITDFLLKSMRNIPKDTITLKKDAVLNIDKVEKSAYPLYQNEVLINGLYMSYNAFKKQEPSNESFKVIRNKKGKITSLEYLNFYGQYVPISSSEVYSFVENGKPYIANEYGFYLLTKKEDDFFYEGRTKAAANNADVMMATIMFGIVGGLIASDNSDIYEIKLDHLNGAPVLIQKIKN